jgi:CheY-like chemotaxis protein
MNLLTNALRYTEHGSVLLACRRRVGKVRIQVWDTGPGIPPELQSEIFTEYVQIGNEERNREKGLGLGLAICRRIAGLLSTQIGIRSVPGHGSLFWFDLPLGKPQEQQPSLVETELQMIPGKVLVVDDDPLCRESAAEVIGDWGGKVVVASDANEALAICREQAKEITLVVCDVRLPGTTDGIALGGLLQQLNPAIRVVLVSAEVTALVQAQARRAGFPILKKPVAPARMRATLLSLLETRRQVGR